MNQPRKKPNLTPLERSDADLDRLSKVGPENEETNKHWSPVANNRNKDAKAFLDAGSDEREE